MRLGVEAAVVEGVLVPGDVAFSDGTGRGRALPAERARDRRSRLRRPAGQRLRRGRLLDSGRRGLSPGRRIAPGDRGDGIPADLHHRSRDGSGRRVNAVPSEPIGPRILGAHLEGPFLSPSAWEHTQRQRAEIPIGSPRAAARGRAGLPDDARSGAGWRARSHRRAARARRRRLGGHSNATAAEAERAFDHGVRTVTHLFNAMPPFSHRNPGWPAQHSHVRTSSSR